MIKNLKQNKTAALFTFMVTAILFYDLPFDITLFIPEQCDVVMTTICQAFRRFSRLPCSLYIPSSHHTETKKKNNNNPPLKHRTCSTIS